MRPAATTALLGLTLVLTAALFDAESLYVPGIAFLALVAAASTWVIAGARGVTVRRTVAVRRALEDQPVAVEVEVVAGRLALPTGVIDEPLLPSPAPLAAGRRGTRLHITARFARRGRKRLAATRVVVRDPFGIAERVVSGVQDAEVFILPRIEPVTVAPGDGDARALGTRRGRPFVAAEVDLDGLRPHRPGTPASRIFWPALARGGEMMERRLRSDSDTRPLVVLDPRAPAREEDLDAAVRAAASLCLHLAPRGGCAVLLPGDRRPSSVEGTLAGWPHLHARLALVTAAATPALAGIASRRGPVVYVAARVLTRPPRALAHAVGGGRILVVPGTLGGRRAAFTVAGCTGYELSTSAARAHAEVA
jgi:uncharacterized protein (DUF58 family)